MPLLFVRTCYISGEELIFLMPRAEAKVFNHTPQFIILSYLDCCFPISLQEAEGSHP